MASEAVEFPLASDPIPPGPAVTLVWYHGPYPINLVLAAVCRDDADARAWIKALPIVVTRVPGRRQGYEARVAVGDGGPIVGGGRTRESAMAVGERGRHHMFLLERRAVEIVEGRETFDAA